MYQSEYTVDFAQKYDIDSSGKRVIRTLEEDILSIRIQDYFAKILSQELSEETPEESKWWMIITEYNPLFSSIIELEIVQTIRDQFFDKGGCLILGKNQTYKHIEERQFARGICFEKPYIFLSFPEFTFQYDAKDADSSVLSGIFDFIQCVRHYLQNNHIDVFGNSTVESMDSVTLDALIRGLNNASTQEDVNRTLEALEKGLDKDIGCLITNSSQPLRGAVIVVVQSEYYNAIIDSKNVSLSSAKLKYFSRIIAMTKRIFDNLELSKILELVKKSFTYNEDSKNIFNSDSVPRRMLHMSERVNNNPEIRSNEVPRVYNNIGVDEIRDIVMSKDSRQLDDTREKNTD